MLTYEPVWTGDAHGPSRGYLLVRPEPVRDPPRRLPVYQPRLRHVDCGRSHVKAACLLWLSEHHDLAYHQLVGLVPDVPRPSIASALSYLAKQGVLARRQTWRAVPGGHERLVWVYSLLEVRCRLTSPVAPLNNGLPRHRMNG